MVQMLTHLVRVCAQRNQNVDSGSAEIIAWSNAVLRTLLVIIFLKTTSMSRKSFVRR